MRTVASKTHKILHGIKAYHTILKQFFSFAGSTLLSKGLTLLFTPFIMHMLTPAQYGLFALAQNMINILTALLGLGLRQALPLFYFQYDYEQKVALIIDIATLYTSISLPILILIFCSAAPLNRLFFCNQAPLHLILFILAITFAQFFVELFYQVLRFEQKPWPLIRIQLPCAATVILCNILFLYIFQWGACALFAGQLIGLLLACCATVPYVRATTACVNFKRMKMRMRSYLWHSLPFIPSMLLNICIASGDRWVLAYEHSLHDVGIYAFASTLSQLLNMIIMYAMMGSYIPHLMNTYQTDDLLHAEEKNKNIMWCTMAATGICLLVGFFTMKPLLVKLIPNTFNAALNYMGLLLIGSVFYLGTHFLNCFILQNKKSSFLGFVLIVPALSNIGLNFLFVPFMGMYGCVVGTIGSYALYFALTLWYNTILCKRQKKVAS